MKRLLLLLSALALCGSASAAKVRVWHHHNPSHHEKAELKGTVMTTDGNVRLARQLKPLPGIDAEHVWAIAEDREGNLLVATGNEGNLFKVTPAGTVSKTYQSPDGQVLCLTTAPDGSTYAGTGPTGRIIRIAPDGTVKTVAQIEDAYIWSLLIDNDGTTLFAATGPRGRIYRITEAGHCSPFYTTKQDHVMCLAQGKDGTLYAGTSKQGLVYRIDSEGKGFIVFDAPQTEVRSLNVTPRGVLAGTSSPSTRRTPGTVSSRSERPEGGLAQTFNLHSSPDAKASVTPDAKGQPAATNQSSTTNSASSTSSTSAPSVPPPSNKENSVYLIGTDGTVRELFREKAMVLCLMEQDDRMLIGTGGDGQLFELRGSPREKTEIARLDHTQIHCFCQRKDGTIVIGTGDSGKLYVLQNRYASEGTILSDILDAKVMSQWGALRWKSVTPAGTEVTVAVRSGNVAEPDDTWSPWSREQSDPHQAVASAPPARFLQYRATLRTTDPAVTPSVQSLSIRYMTTNLPPEVGPIEVPDFEAVATDNPKKLKIKWSATDGNEDELAYSIYYRKEGWAHWVEVETDHDKREYEWDTTTTPAGVYQVKVVASDRRDNPAEKALTGERISTAFVVDHVPPIVTLKTKVREDGKIMVEVRAADALTRLVSASYSLDSRKWTNVFPSDGLFDSKEEALQFDISELKPGTHVLVVRITDAAGNVGSADAVFTVPVRVAGN